MADAGSGLLSYTANRFARFPLLVGASFVSSERCWRESDGTLKLFELEKDALVAELSLTMGISPDVGVKIGLEAVESVDVGNVEESREPSRVRALGAGGARYDFRLC